MRMTVCMRSLSRRAAVRSVFWALSMIKARNKEGPLPWEIGFSKDLIAQHHNLPSEEKPHRAMNGVNHLLLCYQAVVGFPANNS